MRNAPLNFKYKPHKTRFTRRNARVADRQAKFYEQDKTETTHISDSYVKSDSRIASKSDNQGNSRRSYFEKGGSGFGRSGGPGETSYVGRYADRGKGKAGLRKVEDKEFEIRRVARSEDGMSRPEDSAMYLYKGQTTGDNAGDQRIRGIGTIRGKGFVESHGARHDLIKSENIAIQRATEGMTPAEKRAYIKDAQNQFMAGIGKDDRIDPNLRENYLKEEKRIESDHKRFEGQVGADKLRLNNVYNNK